MQGVAIPGEAAGLRAAFLEAYPLYRTVTATCKALQVNRDRFYALVNDEPSFADDFQRVKEAVGDEVEGEMLRRALAGESPMSDTLLIFATKRFRPEYRDSYTVTTKTLTMHVDINDLPESERRALFQLALEPDVPRLHAGSDADGVAE